MITFTELDKSLVVQTVHDLCASDVSCLERVIKAAVDGILAHVDTQYEGATKLSARLIEVLNALPDPPPKGWSGPCFSPEEIMEPLRPHFGEPAIDKLDKKFKTGQHTCVAKRKKRNVK